MAPAEPKLEACCDRTLAVAEHIPPHPSPPPSRPCWQLVCLQALLFWLQGGVSSQEGQGMDLWPSQLFLTQAGLEGLALTWTPRLASPLWVVMATRKAAARLGPLTWLVHSHLSFSDGLKSSAVKGQGVTPTTSSHLGTLMLAVEAGFAWLCSHSGLDRVEW